MDTATVSTFSPPGPGSWTLDPTHFTRPTTLYVQEFFLPTFRRGFGESLKRYGSLLDYLDYRFVGGVPYYCPRPLGAPPDAQGHPPREVWLEIASSNAEIRDRLQSSGQALEQKLWREDLTRWDGEIKPKAIRAQTELQSVDPERLSAEDLLSHLDRCRENAIDQLYWHHFFNVPALLPVGDFLAHAQEWTGIPAPEILTLLQGASPVSRGGEAELRRLALAVHRSSEARSRLASQTDPSQLLAKLRSSPGELGAAANAYLDLVGFRLVNGEDVAEPYALEIPAVLVAAVRSAVEELERAAPVNRLAGNIARVRDRVPDKYRKTFDELLEEARLTYRLRDERGLFCDLWAYGLARRAILAAGGRLFKNGRLAHPGDLVHAGHAEMRALLAGQDGPPAAELAARARYRAEMDYADVPYTLGPPPGDRLPLEWLPAPAARAERALGVAIQAIFIAPEARSDADTIRGLAVSPGRYEGIARVIRGTEEFGRMRKGDVLVTSSTTAAFNVILPLLGAIVTDRGGLLSHAAIVAREYGIPAVVGSTDATVRIPDGARLRVDGGLGEAVVLG